MVEVVEGSIDGKTVQWSGSSTVSVEGMDRCSRYSGVMKFDQR